MNCIFCESRNGKKLTLAFEMIFFRSLIQILIVVGTVKNHYFNSELFKYSNNIKLTADGLDYTVREDGPLGGSLLFLLSECKVLDGLLPVLNLLGEEEDLDGLQDIFKHLKVKRKSKDPPRVSISNLFHLDSWDGQCIVCLNSCTPPHNIKGISTKGVVEILKEGYSNFWLSGDREAMIEKMKEFGVKSRQQADIDTRMLRIIGDFIGSRYFLLCAYLCTHIRSPGDLEIAYKSIFLRILENRDYNFLCKCFRPSSRKSEVNLPLYINRLVLAVKKFETLPYPVKFPTPALSYLSSEEFDDYIPGYERVEGYIYALARCLCKCFELSPDDFTKGGDKEIQALLRHCLDVGFIGDFNSKFRDKLIRVFRERINERGQFFVEYDEYRGGRLKLSFINVLGVLGNFFEKFLNEMGFEAKFMLNIRDEYNMLLSHLDSWDKGIIMETLIRLTSRMFESVEGAILKYKSEKGIMIREKVCINFRNVWFCSSEIVGNIMFQIYNGENFGFFEFSIGVDEEERKRFEILKGGNFDYATNAILTENSALNALIMMFSMLISSNGFEKIVHYPGLIIIFKEFPFFILICGGLSNHGLLSYYFLDAIYKHFCFFDEMKNSRLVHRKVVELIFTRLVTEESGEFDENFIERIHQFIGKNKVSSRRQCLDPKRKTSGTASST